MTRFQRMILGVMVLLIVDVIWVVSSELTEVSEQIIFISFIIPNPHCYF